MSLEHFSRLSQAIVNASETASQEAKTKAQKDAALVVNSIGVQSTPKRTERSTAFDQAVNLVADKIQAARATKQADRKESNSTAKEQPKTLAQLLVEAQDSE
jgi:hypothetical protein